MGANFLHECVQAKLCINSGETEEVIFYRVICLHFVVVAVQEGIGSSNFGALQLLGAVATSLALPMIYRPINVIWVPTTTLNCRYCHFASSPL